MVYSSSAENRSDVFDYEIALPNRDEAYFAVAKSPVSLEAFFELQKLRIVEPDFIKPESYKRDWKDPELYESALLHTSEFYAHLQELTQKEPDIAVSKLFSAYHDAISIYEDLANAAKTQGLTVQQTETYLGYIQSSFLLASEMAIIGYGFEHPTANHKINAQIAEELIDYSKNADISAINHVAVSMTTCLLEVDPALGMDVFSSVLGEVKKRKFANVSEDISSIANLQEVLNLEFRDPDYEGAPTPAWLLQSFLFSMQDTLEQSPEIFDRGEVVQFLADNLGLESIGSIDTYLSIIDSLEASSQLGPFFQELKSEDVYVRRAAAEVLYRLELGRVSVSDDGVKYLNKLYDLKKFNDPDYFVRRLNGSGMLGIMSWSEGKMQGVFNLDLFSEDELVAAEVFNLGSYDVFLAKADETPAERALREEYMQVFLDSYDSIASSVLQGTDVRLNSLDLHEQGWFLMYYIGLK
ncbi:hypothetical protein KAZ57_02965, partial [Patescibacteria group bacterium]|nr:hypothetical protein [Patescibacteria group bacterium]